MTPRAAVGGDGRGLVVLFVTEAILVLLLAVFGSMTTPAADAERVVNRQLVARLGLTDLALFSGPSYTRHPSQTDLFAPFADQPGALERFPAGTLVPPPAPDGGRP